MSIGVISRGDATPDPEPRGKWIAKTAMMGGGGGTVPQAIGFSWQPVVGSVSIVQKASNRMVPEMITDDTTLSHPGPYLDVVRQGDGRYRVRLVKHGVIPRTSYTAQAGAVVKQAQRAGNIPIHTSDDDVRRICRDQLVELI
jgi:hypothetical protein